MLKNFAHLNDAEPFTADDLRDRLTSLSDGGTRYIFPVNLVFTMRTDMLALLIRKQNTGLIIRVLSDKIVCENVRSEHPE